MKKLFPVLLVLMMFFSTGVKAQCACCTGSSTIISAAAGDAPSFFPAPGQLNADLQADHRSYSTTMTMGEMMSDSTNMLENVSVLGIGLRYGISKKISASIQQPFIAVQTTDGTHSGLGDLFALAHYRLFDRSWLLAYASAGMKFPTGNSSSSAQAQFVAGTGSFDPMAALLLRAPLKRFALIGSATWRHSGTGTQSIRFGDYLAHSLLLTRPGKSEASCSLDTASTIEARPSWNFSAGLSGEWQGAQLKGIELLANTGSYTLSATAGCSLNFGRWMFPLAVEVPVYNEHRGMQSSPSWRVRGGISFKIH